ncbi:MAG: helix-turn-helix transcriptional regulator [Oscillospiraceae bacterium]|nr:helix-turn-helix transcriptional regulator [Oscillospiraceae bacterium]
MDELRAIFAANLITLRQNSGLTQAELAERIHYSDKSVSKWERAEALPDAAVLKSLSGIFGVTVDYLLESHDKWVSEETKRKNSVVIDEKAVTGVAFLGVWTLAALLFVIFWILGKVYWVILFMGVPISLIALLVMNTIFNGRKFNKWIVAALVLAGFLVLAFFLRDYRPWQLAVVWVPAELLVLLGYRIRRRTPEEKKDGK